MRSVSFIMSRGQSMLKTSETKMAKTHVTDIDSPASTVKMGETQNAFLGKREQSLQYLKAEILETLDMRFATLISCFQNPSGFPMPPAPKPMQGRLPPVTYPQVIPPPQNNMQNQSLWNNFVVSPAHQSSVNQSSSQQNQNPLVSQHSQV